MKILLISTDRNILKKGSAVRKRMLKYGGLVEELHIIIFSKRGFKEKKIGENVYVYPTNSFSRFCHPLKAKRIGIKILKKQKDESKWVITTQDPFETGWVGLKILENFRKKLKIGFQIQIHTDFLSPFFKKESILNRARLFIAKKTLKKANCVRVVSERIRESILKSEKYKPHCEVNVLPIFVDKISNPDEDLQIKLKEKFSQFNFLILMVSRLESEKNIRIALKVVNEILKKYPRVALLIVGSGSEEKKLKNKAEKLEIDKNVFFEGAKTEKELAGYYKLANTFLNTSNYEGYARTLVESALYSLPIITTDVGIAGFELEKEKNALVCPVGDKKCLLEKIEILIKNNDKRYYLKYSAIKSIEKNFLKKEEYLKKIKENWTFCCL